MADLHIVVTSGDGRRWEGNIPEVLVGPPVYEYSYGRNGDVDITADFMQWLMTKPDGSQVRFLPGTYRVDRTLLVSGRRNMTFLCEGVRFLAGPEPPDADIRTLALWRIQDSDGIVFSGGEVIGRNAMGGTSDAAYDASREAQHAWDVLGVDEFRLLGAKASNVWGDCVYIGPSAGVWTTNFEITDCEFSKTGRQGIAVVAGSDGLVARNRLFEMRRAAFNLEPTLATWGAKRIRYEGNRTGRVRLLWMSSYGRGYNVGDIEVVGNIMEAASGTPVILCGPSDYRPGQGRRGPFKVYDNDFIIGGSPAPGFRFIAVDGLEMSNNRCLFPSSRSMTAVELDDCQGASITNNLFTKASRLISDGGIALGHPASTWTETGNTV